MTRRPSTLTRSLTVLCLLGLLADLPAAASARPTVEFKAAAVPIPVDLRDPHGATYPGTGSILGAPAAMQGNFTIRGSEYGGSPSPLTWIKVYTPVGVRLHPGGFATCSEATLMQKGAEGCPKRSLAGPVGEATGVVTFGETRVPETATVQVFFKAGGGLVFYAVGRTPASFEVLSTGTILDATPAFGQLFTGAVPLVESVPGGLDGSIERLTITIGAAFRSADKLISYATTPRTCPKGGYPIKVELSFLSGETVPAHYTIPCPKHKGSRR